MKVQSIHFLSLFALMFSNVAFAQQASQIKDYKDRIQEMANSVQGTSAKKYLQSLLDRKVTDGSALEHEKDELNKSYQFWLTQEQWSLNFVRLHSSQARDASLYPKIRALAMDAAADAQRYADENRNEANIRLEKINLILEIITDRNEARDSTAQYKQIQVAIAPARRVGKSAQQGWAAPYATGAR